MLGNLNEGLVKKDTYMTLIGSNVSDNTRSLDPSGSCIVFINNGFCEM